MDYTNVAMLNETNVFTEDMTVPNLNSLGNITASEIYDNSLVGWWQFNNNQSVDSSIYGNDGVMEGGIQCLEDVCDFDGDDDSITVANSDSINISGDMTLEFWYETSFVTANQDLIIKRSGNDEGYFLRVEADGDIRLIIEDDATNSFDNTILDTGSNDGSWKHFMWVVDYTNDIGKAYFNNVQVGSDLDYTGLGNYATTNDLIISEVDDSFNGSLACVKIRNRLPTEAEIQSNDCPAVKRYLHLNDLKSENITTDYLQVEEESWFKSFIHIFDNVKTYFGSADDVSMVMNETDMVVKAEVGTPNYYLEGFNEIKIDTNIIAENVFLPAYIRSASNDTIPVVGVGVWTNISFSKGADPLKENIGHIWNDVTNETFTINDGGIYHISYTISIRDTSPNPTAHVGFDMAYDTGSRVQGSYSELDTSKENEDIFVHNSFSTEFNDGDVILVRFIASDEDVSVIPHGTYNPSPASAQLSLHKVANS